MEPHNHDAVKLYKYTEKKHADTMCSHGEIRVGSLYEYREHEQREIRDELDGKGTATTYVDYLDVTNKNLPGISDHLITKDDESYGTFRDVTFGIQADLPNTYIYCLSRTFSLDLMKRFSATACVEILDVKKFGIAVTNYLFRNRWIEVPIFENHDCLYDDKKINVQKRSDLLDLIWHKNEWFGHQDEHRIVFFQPNRLIPVQGHVFRIPEIKEFTKRIV